MKLHEIEKGSKIKIDNTIIIFDHIDGMYSYCYSEKEPEKLLHLSAMTELVKDGEYFTIL